MKSGDLATILGDRARHYLLNAGSAEYPLRLAR
jgi:hypothetical protein